MPKFSLKCTETRAPHQHHPSRQLPLPPLSRPDHTAGEGPSTAHPQHRTSRAPLTPVRSPTAGLSNTSSEAVPPPQYSCCDKFACTSFLPPAGLTVRDQKPFIRADLRPVSFSVLRPTQHKSLIASWPRKALHALQLRGCPSFSAFYRRREKSENHLPAFRAMSPVKPAALAHNV